MSLRRRVLYRELLPSRATLTLLAIALGLIVLGSVCALSMALTEQDVAPEGPIAILGFFVLPSVAILPLFGALREKTPARRALMFGASALLLAIGGFVGSTSMAFAPDVGLGTGVVFTTVFCAPVVLAVMAPAVFFGVKAGPYMRETLRTERAAAVVKALDTRGMVTIDELSREIGLDKADTLQLVQELLSSGALGATLYGAFELIYSARALEDAGTNLRRIILARGQARLDYLAAELEVPRDILRRWLYDLVDHDFSGYINWERDTVYSVEAQQLMQAGRCPACSGELSLAGKGLIHCTYCGAEIIIEQD
jgi:transcription initiation factor IIE alpha subunit